MSVSLGNSPTGMLARVGRNRIGSSRVFYQRGIAQAESSLGRDESGAAIAEAVHVVGERDGGLDPHFIRRAQVGRARRMHAQHGNHCYRRGNLELNVVAEADEHAAV